MEKKSWGHKLVDFIKTELELSLAILMLLGFAAGLTLADQLTIAQTPSSSSGAPAAPAPAAPAPAAPAPAAPAPAAPAPAAPAPSAPAPAAPAPSAPAPAAPTSTTTPTGETVINLTPTVDEATNATLQQTNSLLDEAAKSIEEAQRLVETARQTVTERAVTEFPDKTFVTTDSTGASVYDLTPSTGTSATPSTTTTTLSPTVTTPGSSTTGSTAEASKTTEDNDQVINVDSLFSADAIGSRMASGVSNPINPTNAEVEKVVSKLKPLAQVRERIKIGWTIAFNNLKNFATGYKIVAKDPITGETVTLASKKGVLETIGSFLKGLIVGDSASQAGTMRATTGDGENELE